MTKVKMLVKRHEAHDGATAIIPMDDEGLGRVARENSSDIDRIRARLDEGKRVWGSFGYWQIEDRDQ